jgi:hypothetical protein
MTFSFQQARELLAGVATSAADDLGCEGCEELLARFAEAEAAARPLDAALLAVRNHLSQCACCAYEYETLVEALAALGDDG